MITPHHHGIHHCHSGESGVRPLVANGGGFRRSTPAIAEIDPRSPDQSNSRQSQSRSKQDICGRAIPSFDSISSALTPYVPRRTDLSASTAESFNDWTI